MTTIATGLWVYHDHGLRPRANRKSLPSGSVIYSALGSAVNASQHFINGFMTLPSVHSSSPKAKYFGDRRLP